LNSMSDQGRATRFSSFDTGRPFNGVLSSDGPPRPSADSVAIRNHEPVGFSKD
jgi:hypothetical protein